MPPGDLEAVLAELPVSDHPDLLVGRGHADDAGVIRGARDPMQGWFCPDFGETLAADALTIKKHVHGRGHFGYAMFVCSGDEPDDEELRKGVS